MKLKDKLAEMSEEEQLKLFLTRMESKIVITLY